MPRSVGELRAWVAELDSAGVPVTGGEKSRTGFFGRGGGGSRDGGQDASTHGERGRGMAADGRQPDDTSTKIDLEGGSRAPTDGRVPVLVVGTKVDVGESMRSAGRTLASELGACHVSVVREGCFRTVRSVVTFSDVSCEALSCHGYGQSRRMLHILRLTSSSIKHRPYSNVRETALGGCAPPLVPSLACLVAALVVGSLSQWRAVCDAPWSRRVHNIRSFR